MALTVLGMGLGASSPMIPDNLRAELQKSIRFMDSDMKASPYEWEMFIIEADMDFDVVLEKLREKQWDCIMLGRILRTDSRLTTFFEKIVNAVHKELPNAKLAFNTSLEETREACRRVLES